MFWLCSNDLDLRIDKFVGTVQLDMSSGIAVRIAEDDLFEALWVNRCERITVKTPCLKEAAVVPCGKDLVNAQIGGSW